METVPCPGCTTALEPSATVCPVCMRPRGKIEITRAYATLREMKKQRGRRPFIVVGYLLAAGAAGWLVYRFHEPVIAASLAARARLGALIDSTLASADPAGKTPAPPPLEPASEASTPPSAAAPAPAPPTQNALVKAAPPPSPPAAPKGQAARPPLTTESPDAGREDLPIPSFDASSMWVFYGRVYDLITLQPVANAQLNITTAGDSSQGSGLTPVTGYSVGGPISDAYGRFLVILPRPAEGRSYEIRTSRSGYAAPALYESDIPYATLPLSERRDIVHSAQDGDVTLPPLVDIAGETTVRRDVFLAPRR